MQGARYEIRDTRHKFMRVKRGTTHVKRRKNLLKTTKGFRWGRKNLVKRAKEAAVKAGQHAYRDRKRKKRDFRRLWQIKINAGVREHGLSYSKFIGALKEANIEIDRKILSELAAEYPKTFAKIVEAAKK